MSESESLIKNESNNTTTYGTTSIQNQKLGIPHNSWAIIIIGFCLQFI